MNSKHNKIDLTIIIPALNEEKRIGKTLLELSNFIRTDKVLRSISLEVIVVSADGKDNTHKVALKYGKNLPNFKLLKPGPRVGKGRDVQFAMQRCAGNHAVYMDADLATPLKYLPIFYRLCLDGFDVVSGTRNLKKHHSHLPRRVLSISGNIAYKILGGVWTEDSQCGFKMFSRRAIDICFTKQTIMKWGFDMEILTIARTNRLKMTSVRINDWKDMPGGTFASGKILHNALESLLELTHIAKNRIFRKYTYLSEDQ